MALYDRALPGMWPTFTQFELHHRGGGVFDLYVGTSEGVGFLTAADKTHYEALTLEEAMDVLAAVLDGFGCP